MCYRQDVLDWVSRSWHAVSDQVIMHSFKATGVSSALDGSEDDLLADNMAAALNAHDRENVRDKAAELLFDDEDDGDDSEFEGFDENDL